MKKFRTEIWNNRVFGSPVLGLVLVKGRLTILILVFAGSHLFISGHDVKGGEGSFQLDVLFDVPSLSLFDRLLVSLGVSVFDLFSFH